MTFYNEIDPFACAWLVRLIDGHHIAPGRVSDRSIEALEAGELGGEQCHFFAGIGCWSYALRLAGVRDDAPIWTGSCPCQPFSRAGAGGGFDDRRHLWPAWFRLIAKCRPAMLFGEQVASGPGLAWLDAVFADLEGAGYACAAADLPAAGVGAPHIRQRLYFVAHTRGARPQDWWFQRPAVDGGPACRVADPASKRCEGLGLQLPRGRSGAALPEAPRDGEARGMGHAGGHGAREHARKLQGDEGQHGERPQDGDHPSVASGAARDPWVPVEWLDCTDGVARPVEPGAFPLAHGPATRVGRLRAYGNAIVPHVAATFVATALAAIAEAA